MRFWISLIIVVGLALCIRALKMKRPMIIALLVAYSISVLIITLGSRRADIVTHIGYDPFIVYERTVRSITQGWKTGGLQEAMKHLGWQIGRVCPKFCVKSKAGGRNLVEGGRSKLLLARP